MLMEWSLKAQKVSFFKDVNNHKQVKRVWEQSPCGHGVSGGACLGDLAGPVARISAAGGLAFDGTAGEPACEDRPGRGSVGTLLPGQGLPSMALGWAWGHHCPQALGAARSTSVGAGERTGAALGASPGPPHGPCLVRGGRESCPPRFSMPAPSNKSVP